MLLRDAMHAVIDDGIEAARHHYLRPEQQMKLTGSIQGFEECRNKQPMEIAALLVNARERTRQSYREEADDYWYWRHRELEIEWVANVLSAIMANEGEQFVIVQPTARGYLKAAEIVGVKAR